MVIINAFGVEVYSQNFTTLPTYFYDCPNTLYRMYQIVFTYVHRGKTHENKHNVFKHISASVPSVLKVLCCSFFERFGIVV